MATKILNIPAFLSTTPQPVIGPVILSGRRYTLRLHWSPLAGWAAGAWLMDLTDASGTPLAVAVPVVISDDLWDGYRATPTMPPGRLAVVRRSGTATDPGLTDLGVAVELHYIT